MKKICFIVGTRPEIIKLSPLILLSRKKRIPFTLIHTNQHYSPELDSVFFKELNLPQPDCNLSVGSGTHAEITGNALMRIEKVLIQEKPTIVIVQGDTNSALAGALAAAKLHIPVAHVEAGLRSYFRGMPEEVNRIMIDHLAEYLFAPTKRDADILKKEGIEKKKIHIVGNTIVDAVREQSVLAQKSDVLKKLKISKRKFILVTAHREENVDVQARLAGILEGVDRAAKWARLPVIYPMHHRTCQRLKRFGLSLPATIRSVDPVGFLDSLTLQKNAALVITDSGGLQEESCILGTPCVTVRDNTERTDTLTIGSNMLAGTHPRKIERAARTMLARKRTWKQPFGKGDSAKRIIDILLKQWKEPSHPA